MKIPKKPFCLVEKRGLIWYPRYYKSARKAQRAMNRHVGPVRLEVWAWGKWAKIAEKK